MKNSELLQVAVEAARAAATVLTQKLAEARTIHFKQGDRSNLVTDADQAAEAAVLQVLKARVPDHGINAEESGASNLEQRYVWFVDPLDGTTNYAHGIPHYCTTLAVSDSATRQVLAGVVLDPIRNELFTAARGEGAFLNGQRLHASPTTTLDTSVLACGFPYDLRQNPAVPLALFNRIVQQARGIRRMGSAALDLSYVAAGRYDGYFEFGLKPWDVAAGSLLIEEAGGRVQRIDGAPFDTRVGDILGVAPGIYEALNEECSNFVVSLGWKPRS